MKFRYIVCFILSITSLAHSYDVVGIGSPCVDLIYFVDDNFLKESRLNKGDSQYAPSWDTFSAVIEKVNLKSRVERRTGGSASNTIKGLSCLENTTAFLGKLGIDPSGHFYQSIAQQLNIKLLAEPVSDPTAQIATFVTEDQQRTFFSYMGNPGLKEEYISPEIFQGVKLVHFDGYVIDEFSFDFTKKAMDLAKKAGTIISFDLGCTRIANSHREKIFHLLDHYVDIVFANEAEVEAISKLSSKDGGHFLSSLCPIAVILKGDQGALVCHEGKEIYSPATKTNVMDTTGAGDLFASGFLHGYLKGYSLEDCAWIGNLLGGTIVSVVGAEIPQKTWPQLINAIESHMESRGPLALRKL